MGSLHLDVLDVRFTPEHHQRLLLEDHVGDNLGDQIHQTFATHHGDSIQYIHSPSYGTLFLHHSILWVLDFWTHYWACKSLTFFLVASFKILTYLMIVLLEARLFGLSLLC